MKLDFVTLAILGLFIFAIGGLGLGSFFANTQMLKCTSGDTATSLSCSPSISSGGGVVDGYISFTLDDNPARDYAPQLKAAWNLKNPSVGEFFSSGTFCGGASDGSYSFMTGIPVKPEYLEIASLHSESLGTIQSRSCGVPFYQYYRDTTLAAVGRIQLFVVTGDYRGDSESDPSLGTFKTYGSCDFGARTCRVKAPEGITGNFATFSSYKIYIKYGGWTDLEADAFVNPVIVTSSGQVIAEESVSPSTISESISQIPSVVTEKSITFFDFIRNLFNKILGFFIK